MIIEEKYKIENTNNQEEDKKDGEGEWEEVKKGGKRMKQINTISNFKTSMLGTVFEGIIKQDRQEKGNSLLNLNKNHNDFYRQQCCCRGELNINGFPKFAGDFCIIAEK